MSSLVGGIGIIGQDMVCGFGKKFPMKIKKWYNGWINVGTGITQPTISSYPNSVYSDFVFLKANKTYEIVGLKLNTIARWRIYDKNKIYLHSSDGHVLKTTQDYFVRLLMLDKSYMGEVIIKEVS